MLGTGDLSELALGWATYGVGDQMSHYHVNASVPKTLIQFLLRWAIDTDQFGAEVDEVLESVLDTEISPELVPAPGCRLRSAPAPTARASSGPTRSRTSSSTTRSASATRRARWRTWRSTPGATARPGSWPDLIPLERRHEYTLAELKHWLGVFLERFFHTSQFKRSAMPNAPKVGSGGSLSPRGDWRAPSDGTATAWLAELRERVPDEI